MISQRAIDKVREFHIAVGALVQNTPRFPSQEVRNLRINLLKEEFEEYLEAERNNDLVGVADALSDIEYIINGTAVSYGIPLPKCFDEVHRSNMTKLVDGKAIRREDGKILKPETYEPPNLEKILKESGWEKG